MDQREMDNSSGSFDELESLDTKEKWGYDLETLYKIALQFFKGTLYYPTDERPPLFQMIVKYFLPLIFKTLNMLVENTR